MIFDWKRPKINEKEAGVDAFKIIIDGTGAQWSAEPQKVKQFRFGSLKCCNEKIIIVVWSNMNILLYVSVFWWNWMLSQISFLLFQFMK